MTWPPQSSDLNPIEQIWVVNSKMQRSHRSSKDSAWNSIQSAWASIYPNELSKYILTMRDRCQAVIDAKGGHTRY